MKVAWFAIAAAVLMQGCTLQAYERSSTADQLKEDWRSCVLRRARTLSISTKEANDVALEAYAECQSEEMSLINAYSSSGSGILNEAALRKTTRATIHEAVIAEIGKARGKTAQGT